MQKIKATEGRGESREETATRNATDGSGRLSLLSLPGACASAQVEIGQMEGCAQVCGEGGKKKIDTRVRARAHTHAQISWKRRQCVAKLRRSASNTLLTHFKH